MAQMGDTVSGGLKTTDAAVMGAREGPLDLRRYLDVLNDRKWTIVVFLTVVVGGVTAWTLRQTKIYRAVATVQVELQAPSVLGREVEQVEELGTGSYWNNQEYLQTQLKVIQSREVASRVVKALNLDRDPDFAGPPDKQRNGIEIAEAVRSRMVAEQVRDSRLILISVEDRDPDRARDIANAAANAYLDQNVERMLSATVSALDWLSRQVDGLQHDLEESERALYDFRRDRDILSVSLEDRQNITANQIQKLTDALTAARAHRIELGAKLAEVRGVSHLDPLEMPVVDPMSSELFQQLKRRYAELDEERAGLERHYGQNWPKRRETEDEIARVRASIGTEVRAALAAVEAEYRAAERTEAGLRAALAQVQEDALKLNLQEIEYNRLVREQKNNAKMYELVLGRAKEADLAQLLRVNNLRILDEATTPTASIKPRVWLNVLLAMVIGLVGGIGLAFLLDALDVTVKGLVDMERLGISVLGQVPSIEPAIERRQRRKHRRGRGNGAAEGIHKSLFVHEHPKSTVAESCRSIRTSLLFSSPESELRTLLITSPGPREGKTTVAVNLGIVMAQGGARVLLVDTDMRRPRIHEAVGVGNQVGVSSIIVGQSSLEQAVQSTEVDGLSVLACGPVPPNPADLLHTERFHQLLTELQQRYDKVILDSPPLGAVTDAAILGTQVSGVVLVARAGSTRKEAARHSVFQLQELGARVLGSVLNDVDLSRREYGYYHYYYRRGHYYYGYGEDQKEPSGRNDEAEPVQPGASS
jgi:capsular exopolysaccharide synthesis family protein